ncbi:hypothetical protein [Novosphingobium sp.]|uniref:hypothetical protein n=1 Tax=Novosphingobium sp. TaxID=1874826 RepID=UPI001DF3C757|nr:hypothetical protein [Novosphingobium sp.]MBX9664594.1 hypothetical protein [Novosphingobium sp.]
MKAAETPPSSFVAFIFLASPRSRKWIWLTNPVAPFNRAVKLSAKAGYPNR